MNADDSPDPAEPAGGEAPPIRDRAIRGAAWTTIGHAASQVIRLGGNLVLTRLLFEEAFGLMVLVNVFLQGLEMISEIGLSASIIQSNRGDDPRFLRTAWTLQVIRGAFLWLVCLAIAMPVASFYGHPELAELIPVAGLTLFISGFNSVSLATLRRHIHLGRLTLMQLGVQIASITAMVAWAWWSPSVWALIVGGLVGSSLRLLATHFYLPGIRVGFAWEKEAAIFILSFGSWIMLNTPLGFLADQAQRLVLGKLIPLDELGVFQVALMLSSLPYLLLVKVGSSVLFPAFSRLREEGRDPFGAYRQVKRPILAAGGWLLACLSASSQPVVDVLYDDRWVAAGWMILPVAAGQWFRIVAIPGANMVFALGSPRWLVFANSAKLIGYALFVPLGWSFEGLAGALLGFALAEFLGPLTYGLRLRWEGHKVVLGDLGYTALLVMATAAGWAARTQIVGVSDAPLFVIATGTAVVSVFYAPMALQIYAGFRRRS